MILISFLLDGIFSLFLSNLIPLFTLTSITLKSKEISQDKLIKYSLIFGLLYDITYTNTIGLNALIFFLLVLLMFCYYKKNIYFLNTFIIVIYLTSTYFLLSFFSITHFNILSLLFVLIKGIITNNIYLLILLSIKKINKHKIKQVRKWRKLKK